MGVTIGKLNRLTKGLGNKGKRLITCIVPWNADTSKIEAMCEKVLNERGRDGFTMVFVIDYASAA